MKLFLTICLVVDLVSETVLAKYDVNLLRKYDILYDCLLSPDTSNACSLSKLISKLPYDDTTIAEAYYQNLVCLSTGLSCDNHPKWSAWSPWSSCYPKNLAAAVSQCPNISGGRFRTRKCDHSDVMVATSEHCPGSWMETSPCTIKCLDEGTRPPESVIDCKPWTPCTQNDAYPADCGPFSQEQTLTCGKFGQHQTSKPCDTGEHDKAVCQVNGAWAEWGPYADLPQVPAKLVRKRVCSYPVPFGQGASSCVGESVQTKATKKAIRQHEWIFKDRVGSFVTFDLNKTNHLILNFDVFTVRAADSVIAAYGGNSIGPQHTPEVNEDGTCQTLSGFYLMSNEDESQVHLYINEHLEAVLPLSPLTYHNIDLLILGNLVRFAIDKVTIETIKYDQPFCDLGFTGLSFGGGQADEASHPHFTGKIVRAKVNNKYLVLAEHGIMSDDSIRTTPSSRLFRSTTFMPTRRFYLPWKDLFWTDDEQTLEITFKVKKYVANDKISILSSYSPTPSKVNAGTGSSRISWKLYLDRRRSICLWLAVDGPADELGHDEICVSRYVADQFGRVTVRLGFPTGAAAAILREGEQEQYISLKTSGRSTDKFEHQSHVVVGSENFAGIVERITVNDAKIHIEESDYDGMDVLITSTQFPSGLKLPCNVPTNPKSKSVKAVFNWYNDKNVLLRTANAEMQQSYSGMLSDSLMFNTTALKVESLADAVNAGTQQKVELVQCRLFTSGGERTVLRFILANSDLYETGQTNLLSILTSMGDKDLLTLGISAVGIFILAGFYCCSSTTRDQTEEEKPLLDAEQDELDDEINWEDELF